nr:MAG: hypothetical protein [Cressdnaviricota sp.]
MFKQKHYNALKIRLKREFEEADEFYRLETWPKWIQEVFMSYDRNHYQKHALWMFFWRNGLEAERAVHWVNWWRGRAPFTEQHTQKNDRDLRDLVNKTKLPKYTPEFKSLLKGKIMDMHVGKPTDGYGEI